MFLFFWAWKVLIEDQESSEGPTVRMEMENVSESFLEMRNQWATKIEKNDG